MNKVGATGNYIIFISHAIVCVTCYELLYICISNIWPLCSCCAHLLLIFKFLLLFLLIWKFWKRNKKKTKQNNKTKQKTNQSVTSTMEWKFHHNYFNVRQLEGKLFLFVILSTAHKIALLKALDWKMISDKQQEKQV